MDVDGPWGWNFFDPTNMQEILQKIFESQKLSWQELRNNGSHFVNIEDLCPKAQKRLTSIKKEDLLGGVLAFNWFFIMNCILLFDLLHKI